MPAIHLAREAAQRNKVDSGQILNNNPYTILEVIPASSDMSKFEVAVEGQNGHKMWIRTNEHVFKDKVWTISSTKEFVKKHDY